MNIVGLEEKQESANIIVFDYVDRFKGTDDCETDVLIETCKSMWQDIAECFGYNVAEEEYFYKYGLDLDIMREIRENVEKFISSHKDRALVRRALRLAEYPQQVIKNCGCDYIGDFSRCFEKDCETKLMQSVNAYVKEHSDEYVEWLQIATEKSQMLMIGQIGQDFLAGNMTYGCKRDTYSHLIDEESWLMDAWATGDGWASFTQACLCYFGAVRWKVAVECYEKTNELLRIDCK